MRIPTVLMALSLGAMTWSESVRAQIPEIASPTATVAVPETPPRREQPGRPRPPGPPRVACWAVPSNTASYCGYYCGGGGWLCFGGPRCAAEGVWGWDYHGCLYPRRIRLLWNRHCRQGGVGAYKIDGPHLIHPSHIDRVDP